ncbi:MAG: Lrp/AsnC family transcriptional regulator [Candidatus Aminicenantes bacterium]|nr:Lrp/AsnC family transcriptional regulator [Candidatus Aminicenantes bacterium]
MIDEIDYKILTFIQKNARISKAEIARRLDMAPSGILERLRKLRKQGIIKEYVTILEPKAMDLGLLAFVFIKTNEKRAKWDVGKILAGIPEVLEVHDISGEDGYIVKLRAKDTEHLYQILQAHFGVLESIASTRTTIVLRTIKETTHLPLPAVGIDKD